MIVDELERFLELSNCKHEFVDMEPEWFYDEETGERENVNALAPMVCKHCGILEDV